jgi:hypothetical protein
MVNPSVQVAGATESLTKMGTDSLAHMMSDHDSNIVTALQFAQIAEQGRDVCRAVLIQPVKSNQRIQQEELGAQLFEGSSETLLIRRLVESHGRGGNDVQVERSEVDTAMQADASDASSNLRQGVFGKVDESGARITDSKVTKEWGGGGEADGHVQTKPTFGALRRASKDADTIAPDLIDAPTGGTITASGIKNCSTAGGQDVVGHDGQRDLRAVATC